MELTVKDLRHVYDAVYTARTRWYSIGLHLDVPVDTLDSIKQESGDSGDHLCNVLKLWLKQGGATWGALSAALKSPTVGECQLAKMLEDRARGQTMPLQTESQESTSTLSTEDAVASTKSRIEELEKKYCAVVTTTQKAVRQQAPDIDEFRTTITLLPSSVKREQQHNLQHHLKYIYKADSIDEIFGCLNLHVWDYLNFGLLECIAARYGDPATKKMMEDYKASVQSFRKSTTLRVFLEAQPERTCPEISPDLKKGLQEVKIQYQSLSSDSSLEEVECIRLKLARELALPDFAVELKRIIIGSISIVWALPSSLTAILKEKVEKESFQFIQWADVVEVAIAGTNIYPSVPGSPTPDFILPIAGSFRASTESYPATPQQQQSESPLPPPPPGSPEPSSPVRREQPPEDQEFDVIQALLNRGVPHIVQQILQNLDIVSLLRAQRVCVLWYNLIILAPLWKELINKTVKSDKVWKELSEKRGWRKYLQQDSPSESTEFYHTLYQDIVRDVQALNSNWRSGRCTTTRIQSGSSVRCLQYDTEKIVTGHKDGSIKMWDSSTLQSIKILEGHKDAVNTLQFDKNILVTGSGDKTVRLWDVKKGAELSKLDHHRDEVWSLKFRGTTLVTGSLDGTVAVWDMTSPTDIQLKRVILDATWSVWAVELDHNYIYGADRGDIKVWDLFTLGLTHTLRGHSGFINCLQSRGDILVGGSDDKTVRIWDVESQGCLRVLQGHTDYIWCIGVNEKLIVSGSSDHTIRVWDLQAALDPNSSEESLCLVTLMEHNGPVLGLQFDNFKLTSCSLEIVVWNFLNPVPPGQYKQ